MNEIYFDNAASTRPFLEVSEELRRYMDAEYANPSSLHKKGLEASKSLKYAAEGILKVLNLKINDRKVYFTSGATEAANLAIRGTVQKSENIKKCEIITTTIEHPCVSEVCGYYEKQGIKVHYVNVDQYGQIDADLLVSSVTDATKIVSIIWVNNEFGAVQPVGDIIKRVRQIKKDVIVHIDAVQGFAKVAGDLSDADLITISAHKFHGPKGVGALIAKKNATLAPIIFGGGQQDGLRSGTINAPLIQAMGKACEIILQNDFGDKIKNMQILLYDLLAKEFGEENINTKIRESSYSPYILNVSFEGQKGEVILHMLEEDGIYVSTASACASTKRNKDSPLYSIGLPKSKVESAIRISFGAFNTMQEVYTLVEKLKNTIERLNDLKRR